MVEKKPIWEYEYPLPLAEAISKSFRELEKNTSVHYTKWTATDRKTILPEFLQLEQKKWALEAVNLNLINLTKSFTNGSLLDCRHGDGHLVTPCCSEDPCRPDEGKS